MKSTQRPLSAPGLLGLCAVLGATPLAHAADTTTSQVPAPVPLFVNQSVPPLNLLVAGRDHKLFFPAYNDASDLDGDGSLDIHYIPTTSFTYYGYFDSGKCYKYDTTNKYFVPVSTTTDKTCGGPGSNAPWSGDYLNYLTTSRADALRKVLYGGYRSTDKVTKSGTTYTGSTILERAYVRQDAHAWGKEYLSVSNDGYDIAKYTPYSASSKGNYILFANASLSPVFSKSTTISSNDTQPSLLVLTENSAGYPSSSSSTSSSGTGTNKVTTTTSSVLRIPGWVARETLQAGLKTNVDSNGSGGNVTVTTATVKTNSSGVVTSTSYTAKNYAATPEPFIVRTQVCVAGLLESNCKLYPNGDYKPTGLLHDFGEGNQMYFGLLSGSFSNNLQGGVLRKAISSFSSEVDASTGIFGTATTSGSTISSSGKKDLIASLDGIRLSDPANSGSFTYTGDTNTSNCSTGNTLVNGVCQNWGNPLGEMMYEALNYYSGATSPTSGYSYSTSKTTTDALLGMTQATSWVNPYTNGGIAGGTAYSCAKPFMTVLSDVNPSYDSDLPGSPFTGTTNVPTASGTLDGLNVSTLGQTIWNGEFGAGSRSVNIGEATSATTANNAVLAPTAKSASSFGTIRGLPEEPAKQGTYNAASVAYYGNTHAITTTGQSVKTFAVALSSTLPRIQMPVGTGTVTLVPYGKVVNNNSGTPPSVTEQITGFFVQSMHNMPGQAKDTVNGGLPQAIFSVIFDDAGQGADYDEDASVLYTVSVTSGGQLSVQLQTTYANAGYESHMGYTIAGTTQDGIYLDVTGGGGGSTKYTLDTPAAGSTPNSTCNPTSSSGCTQLTSTGPVRLFTPGATAVTNLQNPLWYAAKWGGFDATQSTTPISGQWDSQNSGTPDNYFLVTNATTLKSQLSKAFTQILQSNNSIARPAVLPVLSTTDSYDTYTTSLNINYWAGDLIKSTKSTGSSPTTTTDWNASAKLPAWGSRKIWMAATPGTDTGLQAFSYTNLSGRTYAGINLQTGTKLDANKVNFLKGDTTNAGSYRTRTSLIGDIINSGPVLVGGAQYLTAVAQSLNGTSDGNANTDYAKFKLTQASRRAQVYVGANDGMLHAFDASTGEEKFAFVPTPVIPNLYWLADPNYNNPTSSEHQYYVDGTPVVADVYFGSAWHTVLVGTLRGGGRGVFALDVTDPDNISLLWEYTSDNNSDLGYTFATPVIVRLKTSDKNGGWAVVLGNGYGGSNSQASLLILDIDPNASKRLIKELTPSPTSPSTVVNTNNGLSSARVADVDSDGIADYVYAGDLQGNLWRFDLTSGGANATVSFGNQPLYSATVSSSDSTVQSITAPPSLIRHPSGQGFIVIFGTGRYFSTNDKTSTTLQTLYGVWDQQLNNTAPGYTRDSLQSQTLSETSATIGGATQTVRTVSSNTVNWPPVSSGTAQYGWMLDLTVGSSVVGERVTDEMFARGSVLIVPTRTPNQDPCSPGLTGWTYGISPYTGGATTFNVFDTNRNGVVDDADSFNNGTVVSGISTAAGGNALSNDKLGTPTGDLTTISFGPNATGRQSWRMIPLATQ